VLLGVAQKGVNTVNHMLEWSVVVFGHSGQCRKEAVGRVGFLSDV